MSLSIISISGCLRSGLSWFDWWVSFGPDFQCWYFCESSCLFYLSFNFDFYVSNGGGRVVRRYWVNFQCRGVLLIWITVGQGPTALAVGAGGGCLDIFNLVYRFSFLSPSLWETARYRLKYCLKGPLSPKQSTNQPNLWF